MVLFVGGGGGRGRDGLGVRVAGLKVEVGVRRVVGVGGLCWTKGSNGKVSLKVRSVLRNRGRD